MYSGSLFLLFCGSFLMIFSQKSPEGPGSRPRVLKRHQNGGQRVTKWSPGVSKFNTKATKSVENLQHVAQGSQNEAPGATMEPQGLHKCKTHIKTHPTCKKNIPERCPKWPNKEEKPYTHKQPTKETNKRTNTHTHKSFKLQTQTQTPAAGCSPKAT